MTSRVFYGWWIVAASFFLAFYVGGIFYGFTAFFEPIVKEFGWSYTQVSIASSLRGLEMGIFAPLVGFLVDRFGPRRLIRVGIFTMGLAFFLLSRTQTLLTFYLGFLILAFGAGGCTTVVLMSVVVNWFRRKLGRALGIMACGFGASGLMVALCVRLIDMYQWRTTFVILGVGIWAIGIPISIVIKDRPEDQGMLPDGEPYQQGPHTLSEKELQGGRFGETMRSKSFWFINTAEFIRMMILAAVVLHVMPYLSSVGIPRSESALIASGIPLLSVAGRFGFGWLGDVVQKRKVMAGCYGMMAIGMLAFDFVGEVWWAALAFLLLFSPGYGGTMSLRGAILGEYFGRSSFGKNIGVLMGIASMGGVLGPVLAGMVYDTLGSYRLLWLAFCGVVLIGSTCMLLVEPPPSTSAAYPDGS